MLPAKQIADRDIGPADTIIVVDDHTYRDEITGWEGHSENLNMVKIGKELIHYLGVSDQPPYRLLRAIR